MGFFDTTYTTYATAPGQRATITLPDDNTVALNVASRLEVPTNYGRGNHMVRLPVGEALFNVSKSHHDGVPFLCSLRQRQSREFWGSSFMRYGTIPLMVLVDDSRGRREGSCWCGCGYQSKVSGGYAGR